MPAQECAKWSCIIVTGLDYFQSLQYVCYTRPTDNPVEKHYAAKYDPSTAFSYILRFTYSRRSNLHFVKWPVPDIKLPTSFTCQLSKSRCNLKLLIEAMREDSITPCVDLQQSRITCEESVLRIRSITKRVDSAAGPSISSQNASRRTLEADSLTIPVGR